MPDPVQFDLRERVAIVRVDDGRANALSPTLIDAIHAALDRAGREAQAVLLTGLALRLYTFPRPVVLACSGHALAAGAVLLCAADLRIGALGNFKIGLNEVSIQLPLPIFAMELARARLSKRWFTQAVTQARIFDPVGARDAGYLDEVTEPAQLLDRAVEHARRLAALPDPAFQLTKDRERRATVAMIRETLDADIALLTQPVL
jgi:enoyl-CoA hydratase